MKFPLCTLLAFVAVFAVSAQEKPAATPKATPRPDPSTLPITDVPGLPRVLLIGDSISMGYTLPVRAKLEGKANVHRPLENCSSTAHGVANLARWLGSEHWDVVHFNFGLHDLKYLDEAGKYVTPDKGKQVAPIPVYEANLREIVKQLKASGAQLIFATTTPVPGGSPGRVEGDERGYNEAAVRVMKELGVEVDDLAAFVSAHQAEVQLPHNVHFTPEGYRKLAELVAGAVEKDLPKR
jgi:acyl-CoA thioesterase-1